MADITDQMSVATSPPEEAAQHIDNAKIFNITPTVFKDYKSELQPAVDQALKPTEATPKVADFVSKSTEHAALAAPDIDKLNYIERQSNLIGSYLNSPKTSQYVPALGGSADVNYDPESADYLKKQVAYTQSLFAQKDLGRQVVDLNLKKMFHPDKYTQDDELKLFQLNSDMGDVKNYGIDGPIEQIPAQVLEGVVSVGKDISKNAEMIATLTGNAGLLSATVAAPGGPLAMGAAFIGGATTGLGLGVHAAITKEFAYGVMASTYNELSNVKRSNYNMVTGKVEEAPVNIDDTTKKYISVGLGVSSAAITAVVGTKIAKSVPFIANILDPRKAAAIVVDPAMAAIKETLFNIGKSASAASGGIATQQVIEIITKEFAKTYTGDQPSFKTALINSGNALAEQAPQIAQNAAVAGIAAGAISTAAGVAGFDQTKKNFTKQQDFTFQNARDITPEAPKKIQSPSDIVSSKPSLDPNAPKPGPVEQAVEVLHLDDALTNISKVSNTTKMKELSPDQLSEVRKDITENAGIPHVYLDAEEVQKFSDKDSSKAKAIRDIIDPSGAAAAAMNAPSKVPTHKFLDLVDKYPDASEMAKATPEGPSAAQAVQFVETLKQAEQQRQDVIKKLGAKEPLTPEQTAQVQQQLAPTPSHDVFNEQDYLNQPTFTKAIESVLTENEVASFNEAQQKARQMVVDNINESAKYEMDRVRSVVEEQAIETQIEIETDRLKNDPNLVIVDRFAKESNLTYPSNRYQSATETTAPHQKAGFSPYAIDPRLLSDKLKKYANDPQLKKHKVFVKGGISPDESARLIGVNGGENLLKILSATPSREDIVAREVALRSKEISDLVDAGVNLNETALAKAYSDNTTNHIAEMKFLKSKEWPVTRGGIRRIALPLPRIDEISAKAKTTVAQTKVGDLNPNQFKVGERKSQRIAIDAILKNEVEKAFVNKEAAALNSEFAKETHIAVGQVNRVLKFARKFNKPDVMQELADAGPIYENAANEILDVYNLNPSKKGLAEQDAFHKWVKKMAETGEGLYEIPERFTDVRKSVNEMTVEQVLLVGDRLRTILHTARLKNKLYDKHENIKAIKTIEGYSDALRQQVEKIYDYDPKKIDIKQPDSKSKAEKFGEGLYEAKNLLERPQHLIVKLDNGQVNGLANDLFYRPIAEASNVENQMAIELNAHLKNIIDTKFGKETYNEMASKYHQISEFENIPSLNYGKLTQLQLLMMNLNRGNEGNIEALERFGPSREVFSQVLDRELDHVHHEFSQAIWDAFKSYESKIEALQMRTEGNKVKFVQPKSFESKGRVYPGGYFPIMTIADIGKVQAERMSGAAELGRIEKFKQKFYAQAMTEQGHLEARTGGKDVLDLSINRVGFAFAQTIHDIAFREPVRDTVKLLSDKSIRDAIVSVIGYEGYRNISDMVIDVANSAENRGYNGDQQKILKAMNYLNTGISVVDIGGKVSSLLVQPLSMFYAMRKMGGIAGPKYMLILLYKIATNTHLLKEYYDFAAELHPPIRDSREDIEGDISYSFNKLLAHKDQNPLSWGIESAKEQMFKVLGHVDQLTKALSVPAAYMQAINGEAPGIPKGDHAAAAKYASNIAELTLTHSNIRNLSPLQKEKFAKPLLMFWNDANNIWNNQIANTRATRQKFKESGDHLDKGEYNKAAGAAAAGVGAMAVSLLYISMSQYLQDRIHGRPDPFDEEGVATDPKKFAQATSKFYFGGAYDELAGTVPVFKDIKYASEKVWERKKIVETPQGKAFNDFATSLAGLYHLLDSNSSVSKKEAAAMFYSAGYLFHLPSDAIYKALGKPDLNEIPSITAGLVQQTENKISSFLKKNEDNPEIPKEVMENLKQLEQELKAQQGGSAQVDPKTLDIIKQIESGGKWSAFNPNTSAAGLYQFTEKTWNDIKKQAPELGLTENGRTAKNTDQQEKAAQFLTQQSADLLNKNGIQPTTDNVYAAHLLGLSTAVSVLKASGDTKLKTLVEADALKANGFSNGTKVKDFKIWLKSKVDQAESQLKSSVGVTN